MPHADKRIRKADRAVTWLQRIVVAELVITSAWWLALTIWVLVVRVDAEWLALMIIALHYVAPFAVYEVLVHVHAHWGTRRLAPGVHDTARWFVALAVVLFTDALGLFRAIFITYPEAEHVTGSLAFSVVAVVAASWLILADLVLIASTVVVLRHTRRAARVHASAAVPLLPVH
jgi:hypothetical protein